jgi:hypothetical protein
MSDRSSRARRIFVIGPMAANGKVLSNTRDIQAALIKILERHSVNKYIVNIPETQYGNDIPNDVFGEIDLSDLIIADISARSPSVMYELAFAHALNIPTILIDDAENYNQDVGTKKKPIFYLNRARTVRLSSRSADDLQNGLESIIASWVAGNSKYTNPLTDFYHAPLVDASGVAGIAAGYTENFLVPVMRAIQDKDNHFGQPEGVVPPIAIIVVVPESIVNLRGFEETVRKRLDRDFPGSVVFPTKLVVSSDKKEARTVIYVQRVIVDVARTVFPLGRSKRVARLESKGDVVKKDMERKLLAMFKKSLEGMIEDDDSIVFEFVFIRRLADLSRTLRTILAREARGNL